MANLTSLYTCHICHQLFDEATALKRCNHIFCWKCIHDKITQHDWQMCPVCSVEFGPDPLRRLSHDDPILVALENNLRPEDELIHFYGDDDDDDEDEDDDDDDEDEDDDDDEDSDEDEDEDEDMDENAEIVCDGSNDEKKESVDVKNVSVDEKNVSVDEKQVAADEKKESNEEEKEINKRRKCKGKEMEI